MFATIGFILGVAVFVAGIVSFFKVKDKYGNKLKYRWVFPVVGLVVFLTFGLSTTIVTVDARQDGVVTSFKKPTGEVLESGAHLTKPWETVHEMNAAAQTTTYTFDVQMAGGAKAKLNVYPSWKIASNAASELYQDYKTFDNVVDSLFSQQLVSTANNIFGTYNPLTNVDPETGELKKTKEQWADELKLKMQENPMIKGKLEITSMAIPIIQPDDNTQANLNLIVAEFAKGGVLDQQKTNALKEKDVANTQAQIPDQLFCMRENSKNGLDAGTCLGGNSIIVDSRKK